MRQRRYALALLLRLLRVRIALRRAYSRSRSPALLDPLVCVRVSPSLGCAVSYALFRGARPGDASVCVCCRRGRFGAVREISARAPAIRLLLLLASWRAIGHDAAVDPLSLLTLRLCASKGPSECGSS